MNNFNEPYTDFQNRLLEEIHRLIPNQDKPIRLEKEVSKSYCYSIADILAKENLIKRHMLQSYVFQRYFLRTA